MKYSVGESGATWEDGMATSYTEKNETHRLIASNKVEGTAVYNRQGEKLGSVYNFMVDKRSGKVEYAVMSFGGFLGMGDTYHPLPWNVLTYDTSKGGYVVDLDKRMLQEAPSYKPGEEPPFDRAYDEQVYGYYRVPYDSSERTW
jgi:sporulation protein YlmC with PRC-barrel domain